MKGILIKIHGKSVKTGEYVYGYFGRSNSGKALIVNMDATKATIVEEESLAQLVGYDVDGNEVYEGDKNADRITGKYIITASLSSDEDLQFYRKVDV